jgi:queuine tRNA-ribosyltransferase
MMEEIRDALDEGRFAEYKKHKLEGMEEYDREKRK